jgi:hypothetical protein
LKRIVSLLIVVAVAAACDRSTEASTGSSSASPVEASGQNDEAIRSSASKIKMIDDPVGDSIPETSPFMDTVAYGVDWVGNDEQGGGTFLFRFEVAAPIPDSFQVPMGHDAAQYSFCLDSDPRPVPAGTRSPTTTRCGASSYSRRSPRVVLGPGTLMRSSATGGSNAETTASASSPRIRMACSRSATICLATPNRSAGR